MLQLRNIPNQLFWVIARRITMCRYAGAITAVICGLILNLPVLAVEVEKGVEAHPVIDQVFAQYEKAFNSGDAKAIGALWKSDGEFVNALGDRVVGREAIVKLFEDSFSQNPGKKLSIKVLSVLALKEAEKGDVVVAEIVPEVNPPQPGRLGSNKETIVLLRTGEKWQIEGVKEVPYLPATYEHLKTLEWLVGNWSTQEASGAESDKTKRITINSNCKWTENKSFLTRTFDTRMQLIELHGFEIIGWDPQTKSIRSWLFESSGGFTQSTWKQDGKKWEIEMKGVLADGKTVSASTTMTKIDDDTLIIESKKRMRDGKPMPDIAQLTLRRVK
jgi:uncharacterized protein (TIGR02246 family)